MSNVVELKIQWIHKLVRKSRTPWGNGDFPDDMRICWYLDNEKKQGIYEYRDNCGRTNGFAVTAKLQEQLPAHIDQKYFTAKERCWVFGFFFTEIQEFINEHIDDNDFLNFTGVTKSIFFSDDSYNSLLDLCEQTF